MKQITGPSIAFMDGRYVLADDRWLDPPVEDWYDPAGGLPADPAVGDRYIAETTANGWTQDYIYEWDGDEWIESVPEEGWMVWMLFELIFYVFFSGGWMEVGNDSFLRLDTTNDPVTGALEIDNTLTVDGSADAVQLTVQAHSTQNENIAENQLSDETVVSGADERGILFSDGDSVNTNTFFGRQAGNVAATGGENFGAGNQTLDALTDGIRNMCLGASSGTRITEGNNNVGVGYATLFQITDEDKNTHIGSNSGQRSTGANNIFIGYTAGSWQVAGSNIFIVDNRDRSTLAADLTDSILYGQMAAAPADQTLRINAEILGSVGAKIGDGGTTNYTEIESDGTLQAFGTATAFDDIRVPLSSIKRLGFADPSWVQFADDGAASIGVYALSFSNTVDQEVYFSIQVPHNWKLGTDLDAHVHWSPSDTSTNSVTWKLEYTVSNINGTFGNTSTLSVTDAGDGTAKKHQYADLGNIDLSAYTANTDVSIMVMCRLYRDVSDGDDYAAGAFLLETDFHYEIDSLGSRSEMSK